MSAARAALRLLLGYLLAVFVAAATVTGGLLLSGGGIAAERLQDGKPFPPDPDAPPDAPAAPAASTPLALRQAPGFLAVGALFTAFTAWPGFLLTLLLARAGRWRRAWPYGLAGLATASQAALLLGAFDDGPALAGLLSLSRDLPWIHPGGLLGGLAYGWWATQGAVSGLANGAAPR